MLRFDWRKFLEDQLRTYHSQVHDNQVELLISSKDKHTRFSCCFSTSTTKPTKLTSLNGKWNEVFDASQRKKHASKLELVYTSPFNRQLTRAAMDSCNTTAYCSAEQQGRKNIYAQPEPSSSSPNIIPLDAINDHGHPSITFSTVRQITLPVRPKLNDSLAQRPMKTILYHSRGERNSSGDPTSRSLVITIYQNLIGCELKFSPELVSGLFTTLANSVLRRLQHLLVVATDFVCGPRALSDPVSWQGIRRPYRKWLRRLHGWREVVGTLTALIIHKITDIFGHQDYGNSYVQTRMASCYYWFRICEITRELESITVPASDASAFRDKCDQLLRLCLSAKTIKVMLKEGKLFREIFDEEMFRAMIRSLESEPERGIQRRARMLELKTDYRFPYEPKASVRE
jgi:hypothetical protein